MATTAMDMLALAPWAVRQQIILFLFVDTPSKEASINIVTVTAIFANDTQNVITNMVTTTKA
jgi:hypothetical protein